MVQIKMYKTPICPYCAKAKSLLKSKGVADKIIEIDISKNIVLREEMLTKTEGRTSVPQIFINDHHIGGCDDLFASNASGELDKLLQN